MFKIWNGDRHFCHVYGRPCCSMAHVVSCFKKKLSVKVLDCENKFLSVDGFEKRHDCVVSSYIFFKEVNNENTATIPRKDRWKTRPGNQTVIRLFSRYATFTKVFETDAEPGTCNVYAVHSLTKGWFQDYRNRLVIFF